MIMNKLNKKFLLKLIVSISLLVFIYFKADKNLLFTALSKINLYYLFLIFPLLIGNYIISSIRWKKLLSIYESGEAISIFLLIKLYFIGAFFNNFLPTSIGGDVYKAMKLSHFIKNSSQAFASTFMERFSGVIVLVILALYGTIYSFGFKGLLIISLFWALVVFSYLSLGFISKKIPKIRKFIDAVTEYKHNRSILVYALVTSVFVQVFSILTQYFIFISLGAHISIGYSFFAFPVIILASFLIPSQNSIGVQDILYASFFSSVGVPLEIAVSASIVYHLVRLLTSLIGGVFYAFSE